MGFTTFQGEHISCSAPCVFQLHSLIHTAGLFGAQDEVSQLTVSQETQRSSSAPISGHFGIRLWAAALTAAERAWAAEATLLLGTDCATRLRSVPQTAAQQRYRQRSYRRPLAAAPGGSPAPRETGQRLRPGGRTEAPAPRGTGNGTPSPPAGRAALTSAPSAGTC